MDEFFLTLSKFINKKLVKLLFVSMFNFSNSLKNLSFHFLTCFISLLSQTLSWIAASAVDKAGLFTLNGGLYWFKEFIISFDPYPQPTLNPAKP